MSTEISPLPVKRRRLDSSPPSNTTLRIYAWNINGNAPFLQAPQKQITSFFTPSPTKSTISVSEPPPPPRASLRDFLRRHSFPHLLLLQEVKIAPTDTTTQTLVQRAVATPHSSPNEPDYLAFFTLPTDKFNATGFGRKVYGVCSLIRRDFFTSQGVTVRNVDWDAEGRFSVIETEGREGWPRLSIWNVYAVNGTEFEYRDPDTGEVRGTRHGRKLEVQGLMRGEVERLEAEGYGVVLAGDMNVARDGRDGWPGLRTRPAQHVRNRRDFVEKFFGDGEGGLGMCDTFREMEGEARRYTYYPRGVKWGESCDRVDYVICSKALKGALTEAGMLDSEQERGPSDHVPVFATFDFGHSGGGSKKIKQDDPGGGMENSE
ncbi:hypothetical protein C1H76_8443 [Elsinoe australis]|uniref:Endonuclease/exonuclease/phosphatase domain-containing protein n=1 Tax=Elsinoe australis TaxID=40998 RepID=A0A4U7AMF8_9PEZI|nr:hypothetical protein C1H76_8443 [Elsinoe australis]